MALLRPLLGSYGITRLADQTRLDIIGIPCWAAIRPNSRTLAVNQGKGVDDETAWVSAAMEAIEFSVAESPNSPQIRASIDDLVADRMEFFIPRSKLPTRTTIPPDLVITWSEGRDLASGACMLVPLDAVALSGDTGGSLPFAQSSNGLAAGLTEEEAIFHALCELGERDSSTLWSLSGSKHRSASAIAIQEIASEEFSDMAAKIRSAHLELRLFDLTSETGLPTVMAFISSRVPHLYFDVASGVCSHPVAWRAALGATAEAAQTRVSNISGSRDDIRPQEYSDVLPASIRELLTDSGRPKRGLPSSLEDDAFMHWLTKATNSGRLVAVPLSTSSDIHVIKVIGDGLEDRSTNVHWRPGQRAVRAITRP
jgi:YcaO-like protein with predicted kinase domain